jgi:5-oxoprolinase (ATP-hydrolysing)
MQVSILSERRVVAPYGMAGGENGQRGKNLWVKVDPEDGSTRTINMGGKASIMARIGDRVIIQTPGGGGYGAVGSKTKQEEEFGEFKLHEKFVRNPHLFRAGGSVKSREAMGNSN